MLYYDNIKHNASGRYHKACNIFIRRENVANNVKIKMRQINLNGIFCLKFLEIFNFLWRKRTFPLPPKIPQPKKIPKSLDKNLNLSTKISIYLSCFLPLQPNTVALFQYLPSASLSLPQKSPSPKSKNYRKTLINYRIPITKMLQFCPSFGASLLQALKDSHFLPLSLASDAISHSLCTLTPPCV